MLSAMAFRFTITDYSGQSNDHKDGDWYEFSPGGITVCTCLLYTSDAADE